MKIAIYGKPYENELNQEISGVMELIEKRGHEVAIYERYERYLNVEGHLKSGHETFNRENIRIEEYTCLISVGGDGTLLDTVTLVGDSGLPVVGLNAGRLGFISSVSLEELDSVISALENNRYTIDERSLIKVNTARDVFGQLNYGMNEITLHKKDTASMIKIEAFIDDEYLNTYWADGLIVSTPTGSTAYNLSCGGPIIAPGSENFVITPIAPHNLNVRPVVVSNNVTLKLRAEGRSEDFLLAIDSRSEIVFPKEEMLISKAPFCVNLLCPEGHTFLNTMRNKLAWGYDKRN